PQSLTAPTIAGTLRAGETLTGDPGSWSAGAPIAYTYEWRRCDSTDSAGTACPAVGAGPSYLLGPLDVGATMLVAVTATAAGVSATAFSAPTAQIAPAAPVDTSPPVTGGLALWFDANRESYAGGE